MIYEQLFEQLELIALVIGYTQTANIGLGVHTEELSLLLGMHLTESHSVLFFLGRAFVWIVRLV